VSGSAGDAQTGARIELRWPQAEIAQLVLVGEHDLGNVSQLEEAVRSVLDAAAHVVVDLSAIEFMDTTLINGLCRSKRQADLRAVRFNVVIGGNEIVARALEVTSLVHSLHGVESLEAALEPLPTAGERRSGAAIGRSVRSSERR
jgi:anti-anti-sigma factor